MTPVERTLALRLDRYEAGYQAQLRRFGLRTRSKPDCRSGWQVHRRRDPGPPRAPLFTRWRGPIPLPAASGPEGHSALSHRHWLGASHGHWHGAEPGGPAGARGGPAGRPRAPAPAVLPARCLRGGGPVASTGGRLQPGCHFPDGPGPPGPAGSTSNRAFRVTATECPSCGRVSKAPGPGLVNLTGSASDSGVVSDQARLRLPLPGTSSTLKPA